ncbi:hypothetical protein G6F65_018535 [Rhizopus arrhizus]|nr:hypothetical protein G6F65_018535 [Rhizopus arrhizus]
MSKHDFADIGVRSPTTTAARHRNGHHACASGTALLCLRNTGGTDLLPLDRLTARDGLAIGHVIGELRRQRRANTECRPCLQLVVQVRLGGIAAVATVSQMRTAADHLPLCDAHAALPQVRQHRVLVIAVVEDDPVAGELRRIHLAGHVVGNTVDHLYHGAIGRREDRATEAEVVFIAQPVAPMRSALADHQQVQREALAGVGRMVVLLDAAPTPEHEELVVERQ